MAELVNDDMSRGYGAGCTYTTEQQRKFYQEIQGEERRKRGTKVQSIKDVTIINCLRLHRHV